MSGVEEPCLVYFPGRGRGEIVRLMMAAAGIQFREDRVTEREQFLGMISDGSLLFGQIPLLKIDGLKLLQSLTISRYVARKAGLYSTNDEDAAFIDMYFEGSRDFMMTYYPIGFRDPKSTLEEIKQKHLPKYLPIFEKILKENNTGVLFGDKLTMADIGLLEPLLNTVEYFGLEALADYPKLKEFYQTTTSSERIAAYLKGPQRHKANDEAYIATVSRVLAWV